MFLGSVIMVCAGGCKKCYNCENPNTHVTSEYCQGSQQYDAIKSGQPPTDANGTELICK